MGDQSGLVAKSPTSRDQGEEGSEEVAPGQTQGSSNEVTPSQTQDLSGLPPQENVQQDEDSVSDVGDCRMEQVFRQLEKIGKRLSVSLSRQKKMEKALKTVLENQKGSFWKKAMSNDLPEGEEMAVSDIDD